MSRLNSVIRRLQAQRDCLNAAAEMIKDHDGIVLWRYRRTPIFVGNRSRCF